MKNKYYLNISVVMYIRTPSILLAAHESTQSLTTEVAVKKVMKLAIV